MEMIRGSELEDKYINKLPKFKSREGNSLEDIEHMCIMDFCNNTKRSNIQVITVPKREETEKLFEKVMAKT